MASRLVIPVDDSSLSLSAIAPGCRLADRLGMQAEVVSVVETEAERPHRETVIRDLLTERDIRNATVTILVGSPTEHLLELAQRYPETLLYMATHARGAVGERLFGSVAAHVMREAGVPVLLSGPRLKSEHRVSDVKTVLVCLGGSEVSERMIEHAAPIAKAANGALRLIQALPAEAGELARSADASEAGYLGRAARSVAAKYGIEVDWEVLHGDDAARAIVDYARIEPGALIAMTTHGRSGVNQLVAGSVAHAVIEHADCPVLVLRPRRH